MRWINADSVFLERSSNVLITARGVAKITDFGLARVKNTARSMIQSLVGTVSFWSSKASVVSG